MAERKAVNKYYPPDWDPRKQGSVNKRVGQHPLRDRAKKLSQGILVIRFELPYNIWCGGCGSHVGMGVRYNAEKSKVGNYYSTPIYKFRMKCHLCDNYFEIQTDPKNHDYVILCGARRKEQRWDPVANEQIVPEDKATQKKLATDPMYKLEHGSDDHQKGKEKVMNLAQLEESRISMKDDYILNRMARDKFRTEKKQLREVAEADRAILEKAALDIALVDETEEDRKLAGLMKYSVTASFEEKQKERRKSIEQRPLFSTGDPSMTSSSVKSPSSSSQSSSSSSSSSTLPNQRHASVALSRRGELKQKLGKALQASYKDPFKSVRKTNGGAIFSSSSKNPSKLGIRLKSPNRTKTVPAISIGKKSIDKTSKSDRTLSKLESSSNTNMQEERTEDFTSELTGKGSSVPAQHATNDSSMHPLVVSGSTSASRDSINDESSALHGSQTQAPSSKTPCCDEDLADGAGSDNVQSTAVTTHNLPEPQANGSHSAGSDPHTSSAESKNTGLQTLMCSYTDSDSESSS